MIKNKVNKLYNQRLPSNKKFGFFFTIIFIFLFLYFYFIEYKKISYSFMFLSVVLLSITLLKPKILFPLNKLWMRLGILLGIIVSPIVMGLIFFGLITPYSLIIKLFGRDELNLKIKKNTSNWKNRKQKNQTNFKDQF